MKNKNNKSSRRYRYFLNLFNPIALNKSHKESFFKMSLSKRMKLTGGVEKDLF